MGLSLEDRIGAGEIPSASVKACANLDGKTVLALHESGEIELGSEALQYVKEGRFGGGAIDYGVRSVDFFPDNRYVLEAA